MKKIVISVRFRQEIGSNCEKRFQIDPKIVVRVEVSVLCDALSAQYPRAFGISSKAIKNDRTSFALHFLRRTLQRFASKTLQNDSN